MDYEDNMDRTSAHPDGWADLRRWISANLRYVADLVLPPVCLHCHQPVVDYETLCIRCWQGIRFICPPFCDKLGIPLPFASEEVPISAAAIRRPPEYDRARGVARFEGTLRNLLHGFKYADRHEMAGLFARLMRSAGADVLANAELIVPVPLHPSRLWQRRFNQSAILAKRLAAETDIAFDPSLLTRAKRTTSQVDLNWEERRQNVADAFTLAPDRAGWLKGRHIVLIDDVITTGATVEACARILKQAGAGQVDCLAMALAIDGADMR